MELDWSTQQASGVTLVALRLQNERATARTVHLENRLDGPVLPPRRHGEPEQGWDREGVTTRIPAGEAVALGYACPADATDPPVDITTVEAATEPATADPVAHAIRQLGDARPPRSVLGESITGDQQPDTTPDESPDEQPEDADREPAPDRTDELPAGAGAVLQPYRKRLETVEALGVASVSEATGLLESNGGLTGIEQLGTELTADAAVLRALAAEATALAARAETASVPTASLRRLS